MMTVQSKPRALLWRFLILLSVIIGLNACASQSFYFPFDVSKIWNRMSSNFSRQNVVLGDPVFIRIFKEEHILQLWMKNEDDTRFKLVKSYPICQFSGALGPKYYEGDMQSPEGFYATDLNSLNPNSQYHLSFNINYPNKFDRALGRRGSFIMVHGNCVSQGCYAMTDPGIEEIYLIAERALASGQYEVPVHIFPFQMTQDRMMQASLSPHYAFWMNLKEGYDYFNQYGIPPKWDVINGEYKFY